MAHPAARGPDLRGGLLNATVPTHELDDIFDFCELERRQLSDMFPRGVRPHAMLVGTGPEPVGAPPRPRRGARARGGCSDALPRVRPASLPAAAPTLGLTTWLVILGARRGDLGDEAALAEAIVLFVVLVAVPLALPLTGPEDLSRQTPDSAGRIVPGDMSSRTPAGAARLIPEDMSSRTSRDARRLAAVAGLAGLVAAVPAILPGLGPTAAAALTLPCRVTD